MSSTREEAELGLSSASLLAQRVKVSACNAGDLGLIPGSEDPQEMEMATHSSMLAWKIPWTEKPGRLQSMGSQSQIRLSDFTVCLFNENDGKRKEKIEMAVKWRQSGGKWNGSARQENGASMQEMGTSLVVQWLRICVPSTEGPGLIPRQGTRYYKL